jgi:endonuclease/exonuclease/phosphatase family metal-dependent hydrolase
MGDLNSGPDGAPYRILTTSDALGLQDASKVAGIVFGPPGTFNGFDITATDIGTIDFIFVPRASTVARYGVLTDSFGGQAMSDHFPLVVDLTVEP